MPISKNQWGRLLALASLLRKGAGVNYKSFKEYMLIENPGDDVSSRTFSRDIETLRKLGADIVYRQKYKSFELKNREWNISTPVEVANIKSLLLSERVSRSFLPAEIRKELRETVDSILQQHDTDIPEDTSIFDFQVIIPKFLPQTDSEIFRQVYQAWENSNYLKIDYCSIKGHNSSKLIVPRIFAWDNGCWYVKGYVAKEDNIALDPPWDIRIFALHRIQKAEIIGKFIPDEEDRARFKDRDLFNFKKFEEVEIEFFRPEADRIKERFTSDTDAIIAQGENSVTIRLTDVSEYTVFPLIFQAMGNVRVIKPVELQDSLRKVAQNIFDKMK
jgi:predicted DNA-binding transcriptional regulator YafY